jgi:DnaJ-class molecular chaperone
MSNDPDLLSDLVECDECDGYGEVTVECPCCDGVGEIQRG